MLDLLDDGGGASRHDGDARKVLLVLGLGDGEAIDVVAAPGEESDYSGEHARLVVDKHRKRARDDRLRDAGTNVMALGSGFAHGSPSSGRGFFWGSSVACRLVDSASAPRLPEIAS